MQMDPKVLLLVLCMTLIPVQVLGAIPRCCIKTSWVPLPLLKRVEKFEVQTRHGACEIDAVVLHFKGKLFCAHPKAAKFLKQRSARNIMSRGRNSV
ncbi:C-C motif chemokine 27b [Electrophorus electricus]|uniref:C-C motif chemokine 27b n=1 Tax=Electrophorus electricus TaxID=8005 RepID=UPI0015D03630|nr:C-C motif chemokine 27b [Electrophorus electricus]